jgi:hypothetical protein
MKCILCKKDIYESDKVVLVVGDLPKGTGEEWTFKRMRKEPAHKKCIEEPGAIEVIGNIHEGVKQDAVQE